MTVLTLACAACDKSAGESAPCASCGEDEVCVEEVCIPRCENTGTCGTTQLCVPVAESDAKICAEAECGCLACASCPEGSSCDMETGRCEPDPVCTDPLDLCRGDRCTDDGDCEPETEKCHDGTCWPADACLAESDCLPDDVCDDYACRPCVGDECPPVVPDCVHDGCDAPFVCDEASGECVLGPGPGACGECLATLDCGVGDWVCALRGGGKFCLEPCAISDDCETGWTCEGSTGGCVPLSFTCSAEGCTRAGCEGEQVCDDVTGECTELVCDTVTGDCIEPTPICEVCQYGYQCGPGMACLDIKGLRRCVSRCASGDDCPEGWDCLLDPDTDHRVCSPADELCCLGDGGGPGCP